VRYRAALRPEIFFATFSGHKGTNGYAIYKIKAHVL